MVESIIFSRSTAIKVKGLPVGNQKSTRLRSLVLVAKFYRSVSEVSLPVVFLLRPVVDELVVTALILAECEVEPGHLARLPHLVKRLCHCGKIHARASRVSLTLTIPPRTCHS